MTNKENGNDWYERWQIEPVLVVPRIVKRVSTEHFGMEYNEVILEPVSWGQMEEIKRQQGKL